VEDKVSLKIKLTSVLVDDQDKALKFYTEVLGFVKSKEIPFGAAPLGEEPDRRIGERQ
jgi:catechol 2,3-dioxygenase-like lactoylglutathione lyase family enzyme